MFYIITSLASRDPSVVDSSKTLKTLKIHKTYSETNVELMTKYCVI